MKRLLFLLFSLLLFAAQDANAQGWQWALTPADSVWSTGVSAATDASGNVYLLGNFGGSITFGSTTLTGDIVLAKFDSSGNFLWAKTIYGSGFAWGTEAASLAVDATADVYITGSYTSDSLFIGSHILQYTGGLDGGNGFLAKYDSSGNVIWAKNLNGGAGDLVSPSSVSVSVRGDIFVSGVFLPLRHVGVINCDTVAITFTNTGIFLVKYDSAGNALWGQGAEGSGGLENTCNVNASASDDSGNVYLIGYFQQLYISFGAVTLTNIDSGINLFLVKYDRFGNAIWGQSAGYRYNIIRPGSIFIDVTGHIYLTGNSTGGIITFGASTVTGDAFITKYDASGAILWATSAINNSSAVNAFGANDDSSNIYVTGQDNLGGFFIQKFDSLGNSKWDAGANNGNNCSPQCVTTDRWANVYVTGSFSNYVDFGTIPLANTVPYTYYSQGHGTPSPALFLAKLEGRLKDTKTPVLSPGVQGMILYPNPAVDNITIAGSVKIFDVKVTDLLGNTVFSNTYDAEKITIYVSDLPTGMYLIKINGTEVRKFVKE